jgi:hypothetical protein
MTKGKVVPLVDASISIPKPEPSNDINRFRRKGTASVANVETLQTGLPHHSISQAKDFVRLHPNEETHWSGELCFVSVPIEGSKSDTLHLILDELATKFLPSALIKQFRLALASKPYDRFFLCHVPVQNMENKWNQTNVQACQRAKTHWVMATSRKAEGVDAYKVDVARDEDTFPEPAWPTQSLNDLIDVTFAGCMIEREDHPGLLRLIGARQSAS